MRAERNKRTEKCSARYINYFQRRFIRLVYPIVCSTQICARMRVQSLTSNAYLTLGTSQKDKREVWVRSCIPVNTECLAEKRPSCADRSISEISCNTYVHRSSRNSCHVVTESTCIRYTHPYQPLPGSRPVFVGVL